MDTETAKTEREKILAFFDEATIDELSASPGCSKKRGELIISLRPFKTWNKLVKIVNKIARLIGPWVK